MNFYTNVTIKGTLTFDKDIVGNLPAPSISSEEGNIISYIDDGLYVGGVVFANPDYQDPAISIYGEGTTDFPLSLKMNLANIDDNRINNLNIDGHRGLYVSPEELSPDAGNILTYHPNGLYASSPSLKYKDVGIVHIFNEDQHDLTIRPNNSGLLLKMKDVFVNETNVKIVSFIPMGIYLYVDTSGTSFDVTTTVGITSGYDCFVSMSPFVNKVLNGQFNTDCSVTNKTSHPIVRIFYTSD